MSDIGGRARDLFRRAGEELGRELDGLIAAHAAKGLLLSGATIKGTVRIFETVTAAALDQALSEGSARIQGRGRKWAKAMDAIERELSAHVDRAPELLGKALCLMPDAGRLAAPLIDVARASLLQRARDYRDQWTAPAGKRWPERYPVWYALALLAAGALIGEGVKLGAAAVAPAGAANGGD